MTSTRTQLKKRKLPDKKNYVPVEKEEELAKQFVKTILHKLVDLEWREADLCRASGIPRSTWSEVRNYKRSPSIDVMVRACMAVGLDIRIGVDPKG